MGNQSDNRRQAQAEQFILPAAGLLQRKCDCGNHTLSGNCDDCAKKKGTLQRKSLSGFESSAVPSIVHEVLRSPGQPLDPSTRAFMEPRFGYDFSRVRVHTDARAAQSARVVNALAYTVGHDLVFESGEYAPSTSAGRRLLAHELSHVVQQSSGSVGNTPLIQRQPTPRRSGPAAARRLEFRPSVNGTPCACLVFIHNNETNARAAAEELHNTCRYNLSIIQPGGGREIPVPGRSGTIDPNELFPRDVQEECTRNEAACTTYLQGHNDLRAMQIQFFLSIRDCSNNFSLPTVALHNNVITDTQAFLRSTSSPQRQGLRGDFAQGTATGTGSRQDLRTRLGARGGMMDRARTTNIFRWCNLPEISRCHVGDPEHPDNVIWATTVADFDRLSRQPVNVVLQEGQGATAAGSESETDLSTLYLRQPNTRYVNIETPGSPTSAATRADNLTFIREALGHIGLRCCDPPVTIEPMLPNPLPYVEATHLVECVRIMGEENGEFCRQQIMSEMGERDMFGRPRRPSLGRPPLD
jgi:hypothetical protein